MPASSGVAQVGRDLEQHGQAARQLQAGLVHPVEQAHEFVAGLQVAQPRRVGRRDVDGEIGGARPEPANALGIVGHAVFGILVGADVDADDAAASPPGIKAPRHDSRAIIVEAHAVDDGLVFLQPEETRRRVAGLRLRRHRSHLDEAEALPQHGIRHLGILVEARRKAERIGKVEPHERLLQQRIAGPRGRQLRQAGERLDRQAVGLLGIKRVEEGPREMETAGGETHDAQPSGKT